MTGQKKLSRAAEAAAQAIASTTRGQVSSVHTTLDERMLILDRVAVLLRPDKTLTSEEIETLEALRSGRAKVVIA